MDLSPKEESALRELRKRVDSKLPSHMSSDYDVIRWLRARNFNVNKAEDMLLKSLEWRKTWKVDKILDWNPPEVLINYYAYGCPGYGKNGNPVLIVPQGECDLRGLLHCCSKTDVLRYAIQIFEGVMKDMRTRSEGLKVPITEELLIFDMENFSFIDFTWKPALDVILQVVQIYDSNYPDVLKICYVINAPKIFAAAFAIIKPFFNEVTAKKIKIYGRTDWQEAVLEHIPSDQLPVHWGGTMTDEDGNPKCPSKICLGGKVPKSFYIKNRETDDNDVFKSLTLPKSEKKEIELEVKQENTELRWEFHSDDFDVGFEISRILASGEAEVLQPYERVNSHIVPETGSLKCTEPGLYKITFDNQFSYLRSKKIYYKIQLQPSEDHSNS